MSKRLMQRLVIPSALVVAIAALAGCSGGHHSNPATGTSTAPLPAAVAPVSTAQSPLYSASAGASNATAGSAASAMAPAGASSSATAGSTGFAPDAERAGMLEIKLADLALKKSHDSSVKSFARRMKKDHTAADKKLQGIVGSSEQLPADLTAEQQQTVSSLESKSGKDFDKAYADQTVEDHQQAVSLFENATSHAPTQQLRDFASHTLPTLKEHLKDAQHLQSKLGG
ncbi:MAG: DUF4142 domain-containing protein [Rhodanobacteraceae bacterium]